MKSARPKLCLVITKSNWGGAQRYVYDIATTLSASHDVTVLLGGRGPLYDKLASLNIDVIEIPHLERDIDIYKEFKVFIWLLRTLRDLKPDILHLNSSKIGGLGALAGRLLGIHRIVFTAHGWAFNENRNIVSRGIILVIYWLAIGMSHATIIVSRAMAQQIYLLPYINHKIRVIHNGLEKKTLETRKKAREILGISHLPTQTIVVGSIGELHPIKGHVYALEALSLIRADIHYVIIGEGEYREILERKIKKLGLEKRVTLAGHLPQAAQLIKAFDIFVHPSLSEGLGLVLIEAGFAGVPVLATAVGGVPEIVDDMHSGLLVQPRNARELAYGIEFYIQHPDMRDAYATTLQDKVRQEYSLTRMIRETEKVYVDR